MQEIYSEATKPA